MTDITILYDLKEFLSMSFPAVVNTTITAAEGSTITFANNIGAVNAWVGGIIVIKTSPYKNLHGVIISNTANSVTLVTPIVHRSKLSTLIGKAVDVTGGPLGQSRFYITDPDNVDKGFDSGKNYLVVMNISGGGLKQKSMGAGLGKGVHSTMRETDIEIACETKDIVGARTPDEVYLAAFGLHQLKDQVLFLAHNYINSIARPIMSPEFNYQLLSYIRPGSPTRLRACVIEFSINTV
jgi:hypothetical protein